MTIAEATKIAQDFVGKNNVLIGGRIYDDYVGFFVAPESTDTSKPAFVGSEMVMVNKETGKACYQGDLENPDEFYRKSWIPTNIGYEGDI